VLSKAQSYDNEAGRKTIKAMVSCAELNAPPVSINGDISTVMSPRHRHPTWAENARIFGDIGFAFPRLVPQQVRRAGAARGGRVFPALLRGRPEGQRGKGAIGLRVLCGIHSDIPISRHPLA